MTLPVLSKTWDHTLINTQFLNTGSMWSTFRPLLRFIKDTLVSWGWTVEGSAGYPGSVWGYGMDGVDRWTEDGALYFSAYDATRYASWIVLRKTDAGGAGKHFYLMLSCNGSTTSDANYPGYLYISFAWDPYTGGSPPRMNNMPVSVSSTTLNTDWHGIEWTSATANVPFDARAHAIRSTDDAVHRFIVCNTNTVMLYLSFEAVEDALSGWTHPFVVTWNAATATYANLNDVATARVYHDDLWGTAYLASEGYASATLGENITYKNEISGDFQMAPVTVISNTPYMRARLGRLYDVWWSSTEMLTGDSIPGDETAQFVVFNNLIMPWNGVAPITL